MTGAHRDRVPALYEPVLDIAIAAVHAASSLASLYVYGSVATGTAHAGSSDVDLLSVGLSPDEAAVIGRDMSLQFSDLCRAVEVAAAIPGDFVGETYEAYGGRVFLRHYCVHLAGPQLHSELADFSADARAARGFNGDIGRVARRWRKELEAGEDPVQLSRRLARKTLYSVAGLVSMHDSTWTTDKAGAAIRWAEVNPSLAGGLQTLVIWASGQGAPTKGALEAALDGVVAQIVASFETTIGLWDAGNGH